MSSMITEDDVVEAYRRKLRLEREKLENDLDYSPEELHDARTEHDTLELQYLAEAVQ